MCRIPRIISHPKYGWADFLFEPIGLFRMSYIDDLPDMVLNEMIESLETYKAFEIIFDAEGYEYSLKSDDFERIYFEMQTDENEIQTYEILLSFNNFIRAFILDIEEDIDDWVDFAAYIDTDKQDLKENKLAILNKIEKIKNLLESKQN